MGQDVLMATVEHIPMDGARSGAMYAPELQRGRLLSATFTVVGEQGYEGLSARRVSERAGVSNRTFYKSFSDREDCFLAAFNHAVDGLELEMRAGWDSELGWTARVRAGLTALLQALDREPAVRRLVFVEALAAGPRVLARRARVLESLAGVIDQGRANSQAPSGLPGLTAEGVVGATFGVIHARLLELRPEPLVALRGALMASIVFPYRGSKAATRELADPARSGRRGASGVGSGRSFGRPKGLSPSAGRVAGLIGRSKSRTRLAETVKDEGTPIVVPDYRLTIRTQMAIAAVAGRPGLNNREVSEIIGLADQGQISRMMKRLSDQGLIEDAQGHTNRQTKAWRLTRDGEAVIDAHRGGRALIKAQRTAGKGGRLATTRSAAGRRGKHEQIAAAGTDRPGTRIRMTVLTRQVLAVVAELGGWGSSPTNREIAAAAGVKDEGQISKLLARLQAHGVLENTGGPPKGANAWRLTPRGEELVRAGAPFSTSVPATKESR
jgi:AcrR family transcriptional regulator/DNA-binding MarR family transcriptional regulator